jgi:predicted nucleotidyltransferase
MMLPFTPKQLHALDELRRLWQSHHAFVLIGAGAITCHRANPRVTTDLDLVLAASLAELPAGLDQLPGWTQHPRKPHEWRGPGDVRIDIVPASPDALAAGYLDWPGGTRMTLTGLRHAFARQEPLELAPGATIGVAPLAVLALLKVISYLDRPGERVHDLEDLAFIMAEYAPIDDERRWSDELIELQLPVERTSSYLLGGELATFVDAKERSCIEEFLQRLDRDGDSLRSQLIRLAPSAWHRGDDTEAEVFAQFDALARGLGT